MRVVVEIVNGPQAGHKFLLKRGQMFEVGRSHRVDLAINSDAKMSGCHFKFHHDPAGCFVEDMKSTNGTFLNGQAIQRATLRDRDRVQAGLTEFFLHIEGDKPSLATTITQEFDAHRPVPTTSPAATPHAAPWMAGAYEVTKCASGLLHYTGDCSASPPASLNQLLGAKLDRWTVVALDALSEPTRGMWREVEYLYPWLPEETKATSSPLILTAAQAAAAPVVEELWGKDALVVVYTAPDESPIEQLQRGAGAFCRPSLLRTQLTDTPPEFASALLGGIEVVLVEAETLERWTIFASEDLSALLKESGMTLATESV